MVTWANLIPIFILYVISPIFIVIIYFIIAYVSKLPKVEEFLLKVEEFRLNKLLRYREKDYFNRGCTLGNDGYYEEALKAYDKAIELNPDYADAWVFKGAALDELGRYEEGRYEEALKAYDKAIELKPDDAKVWHDKGGALCNLGRYEEALEAFDKAIELKQDYGRVWVHKAYAYSHMGDKRNALQSLSKAIELDAEWKEYAKKNEYFSNLWDDEDFKRITR